MAEETSGMDIPMKSALKTMYGFDKYGNPVFAGEWVSTNMTKDDGVEIATGEDYIPPDGIDGGIATGEKFK